MITTPHRRQPLLTPSQTSSNRPPDVAPTPATRRLISALDRSARYLVRGGPRATLERAAWGLARGHAPPTAIHGAALATFAVGDFATSRRLAELLLAMDRAPIEQIRDARSLLAACDRLEVGPWRAGRPGSGAGARGDDQIVEPFAAVVPVHDERELISGAHVEAEGGLQQA